MLLVVLGLFAATLFEGLGGPLLSISSPATAASPTASPASSATVTPAQSANPVHTLPPIVPPRDAPAVRATTPPLSPSPTLTPPPLPSSAWLGPSTSISVPLMVHASRPYIQGLIDGHPAVFVVDSGAVVTAIDPQAMEHADAGFASVQIGELRFPHLQPATLGVRNFTETYFGEPADGVIGRDLLQRFPVAIDFPNRTLTIFRDSKTAMAARPPGATIANIQVMDGVPAVQATLDSQSAAWFALRTGAGFELQLQAGSAVAARYRRDRSISFYEPGLSADASGVLVRAHTLAVGTLTFNQPLIAVMNESQPSTVAGSIGSMTLSRLGLWIDEPGGTIGIVAPAHATSAQIFEPSGITLMLRRDVIVVRSVVPGTPADSAHVRPGDEIVAINGLAPATLDFARQLLNGSPGARVALAYRRWHMVHYATITLHVII